VDRFAAAVASAIRVMLRPWREQAAQIDPPGSRLLWVFWRALLAVYYAHRGPTPSVGAVDKYATLIAEEFAAARAAAVARSELHA
jgi:hypothetical protein